MISKKKFVIALMVLVVFVVLFSKFESLAQDEFPNRPIEVIVGFPPGGSMDLGARFFSDKWAEFLGQPVIVVNKAGASGAIAAKFVARAKPDGYTLLASSDTPNITARLERKDAGYELDSFRYLWCHSKNTTWFSVRSDPRWKTLHDLLKEAKSNPGKLKYATFGPNSPTNMAMLMLCDVAGVKLTFVPFKSSPESLAAVAGGNVDIAVTFSLAGLGTSGMIRTLAISDDIRAPDYPDIPTLKELGYSIPYKGMYLGIAAPRETPEKVLSKLKEAHNKVRIKYAQEINEKLPKTDQYGVYLDEKEIMPYLKEKEKLYKDFYLKIGFKAE